MSNIKRKIIHYLRQINYEKNIFYFLMKQKNSFGKLRFNLDTRCLVLSCFPGAEIIGLGGLICQNPKSFEVLCFTNGSSLIKHLEPLESAIAKKQQFSEIMKMIRVKGYKIFDIEDGTLKDNYSTFKKIDISEVDYIFLPNVYDANPDAVAILRHFKQLMCEKEYKKDLQIIMYETQNPLVTTDYFVDISSIIETKTRLLKKYYPEEKNQEIINKIIGLNAYRSIGQKGSHCEAFMAFSPNEFLNIPMI